MLLNKETKPNHERVSVWFIIFKTLATGVAWLCFMLLKYCKTFDSAYNLRFQNILSNIGINKNFIDLFC